MCAHKAVCRDGLRSVCTHTHTHTHTGACAHTHTHTHTLSLFLSVCGLAEYLEGRRLCVFLCVHWGSLCPGQRWPDCGVSGVPKKGDDWDGGADPPWVQLLRNVEERGTWYLKALSAALGSLLCPFHLDPSHPSACLWRALGSPCRDTGVGLESVCVCVCVCVWAAAVAVSRPGCRRREGGRRGCWQHLEGCGGSCRPQATRFSYGGGTFSSGERPGGRVFACAYVCVPGSHICSQSLWAPVGRVMSRPSAGHVGPHIRVNVSGESKLCACTHAHTNMCTHRHTQHAHMYTHTHVHSRGHGLREACHGFQVENLSRNYVLHVVVTCCEIHSVGRHQHSASSASVVGA